MKKKNIIIIAAISLLLVLVLTLSLKHKKHEEVESEFKTISPWRETIDIKKEYVAQIRAIQHIEVRSLERGYLQKTYVDEGQFVKKDQEMFQIMPLLVQAELKKAQAEYQLAKIEYDNTAILQKKAVVSVNELALAKAKLEKAEAEMSLAQTHLEFTTIKAPFDGIMDRFYARLGSLVEEGELLTTLSDNSQMWVYFNVSEADYLDYMHHKKNDEKVTVSLVLANGELFPHQGVIDTIEADFDNEVGNVAFRASFPNPDGLLRHGETGTILLTKKHENALIIPQKATFEILDKKFVYTINDQHEVTQTQITIANEVPYLFLIDSGLDDDDEILLEGLGKVHNGEKIKTEKQDHELVEKNLKIAIDDIDKSAE